MLQLPPWLNLMNLTFQVLNIRENLTADWYIRKTETEELLYMWVVVWAFPHHFPGDPEYGYANNNAKEHKH